MNGNYYVAEIQATCWRQQATCCYKQDCKRACPCNMLPWCKRSLRICVLSRIFHIFGKYRKLRKINQMCIDHMLHTTTEIGVFCRILGITGITIGGYVRAPLYAHLALRPLCGPIARPHRSGGKWCCVAVVTHMYTHTHIHICWRRVVCMWCSTLLFSNG